MTILLISVAVIVVAAILVKLKINKDAENLAAKRMQNMYPLWAAQAPFANGTESASAMWVAWAMTESVEFAQTMEDSLLSHRQSFDSETKEWESTIHKFRDRQLELPYTNELIETFHAEADRNGWLEWLVEKE